MISVKPWALFRTDFPSDMVYVEGEEPVHGGKNVAEAIREILQGLGCTVERSQYAGEHGWEFGFSYQRLKFWMQVSEWGAGHAMHWRDSPALLGPSDSTAYFDFLLKLNEELNGDGRFHEIAWYGEDDLGDGQNGCALPVIGELPRARERFLDHQKLSFIEKLLAPLKRRPGSDD